MKSALQLVMTPVVILELPMKPQVAALGTTMAANIFITKLLQSGILGNDCISLISTSIQNS